MDIVVTTNTLQAGGAEVQRVNLANELSKRGHFVRLVCLQGFGDLADLVSPAVSVERHDYRRGARGRTDVVLTGTTNTETAYGAVSRYVTRATATWQVAIHNPVSPLAPSLKPFTRRVLPFADSLTALTERHAAAIRMHWGLRCDRVISNGIDVAIADHVRAARIERSPAFDIGFIGRLSKDHKGLDRLLDVAVLASAEGRTVAVAGVGPDREWFDRQVSLRGIQRDVKTLGFVNQSDFLKTVRVLVVPSRYEAQPMVILEAQGAGVPIVATTASNMMPTSSDIAVEYDDASGFYSKIQLILGGLQKFDNGEPKPTSVAEMAQQYESWFREALRARVSQGKLRTASPGDHS